MRITGPHLVGAFGSLAGGYKACPKDQIFLWIENGVNTAVLRGDFVCWELTDNTAAAIYQNTLGQRIEKVAENQSNRVAGCAETDISANATPASARGLLALVQTYGYHDAALVTLPVSQAIKTALVMSATSGRAREFQAGDAATSCMRLGFIMTAGSGGGGNQAIQAFIRCMGG